MLFCEKAHPVSFRTLGAGVKINRFPNTSSICRKDRLIENYHPMQKKHGRKAFNFIPKVKIITQASLLCHTYSQTYNLPEQEKLLKLAMKKQEARTPIALHHPTSLFQGIWIVKPPGDSCGKGIRLVTNPDDVLDSRLILVEWHDPSRASIKLPVQNLIVQRYISNPFLINGLKFDLRLYVLITSIDPIKVYLHDDGLVRFATQPFSTDDLDNKFIHLTNYAINKNTEEFVQNENPEDFAGHKWSVKTFRRYLECQGHDWGRVWNRIRDIVSKTVLCGHNGLLKNFKTEAQSDYSCYKIFGIDIFLDDKLKPWLLEFNSFPSLCEASLDRHVNEPMIAEAFNIAGFHLTAKIEAKKAEAKARKTEIYKR